MKAGGGIIDDEALDVAEELNPTYPPCMSSWRGPVVGGDRRSVLGQHLAAAMALVDKRRSASVHVLNAADENAQKSKPNGRKTNAIL